MCGRLLVALAIATVAVCLPHASRAWEATVCNKTDKEISVISWTFLPLFDDCCYSNSSDPNDPNNNGWYTLTVGPQLSLNVPLAVAGCSIPNKWVQVLDGDGTDYRYGFVGDASDDCLNMVLTVLADADGSYAVINRTTGGGAGVCEQSVPQIQWNPSAPGAWGWAGDGCGGYAPGGSAHYSTPSASKD